MRKPNRLVTALGTSALWQMVVGVAMIGVGFLLPPAALATALPVMQIAGLVACIGGMVSGWRHASQMRREIDAVEQGAPVRVVQEVTTTRSPGKSFVAALQAERAQEPAADRSR